MYYVQQQLTPITSHDHPTLISIISGWLWSYNFKFGYVQIIIKVDITEYFG
jgi:hypothetical protein